jgi:hypothetical protein
MPAHRDHACFIPFASHTYGAILKIDISQIYPDKFGKP